MAGPGHGLSLVGEAGTATPSALRSVHDRAPVGPVSFLTDSALALLPGMLRCQRPVGRSAVSGLQVVGPAGELMQSEPQSSCNAVGYVPGRIGDATLKAADGGGVEIGGVGQGLLREPDFCSAKGNLGASTDPHA